LSITAVLFFAACGSKSGGTSLPDVVPDSDTQGDTVADTPVDEASGDQDPTDPADLEGDSEVGDSNDPDEASDSDSNNSDEGDGDEDASDPDTNDPDSDDPDSSDPDVEDESDVADDPDVVADPDTGDPDVVSDPDESTDPDVVPDPDVVTDPDIGDVVITCTVDPDVEDAAAVVWFENITDSSVDIMVNVIRESDAYQLSLISGATITSSSPNAIIDDWLWDDSPGSAGGAGGFVASRIPADTDFRVVTINFDRTDTIGTKPDVCFAGWIFGETVGDNSVALQPVQPPPRGGNTCQPGCFNPDNL